MKTITVAEVKGARLTVLLKTYREFCAKHKRPPTIRGLAALMGNGCLATIHGDLQELAARGDLEAIQVPYGTRKGYRVVDDAEEE